MELVELKCKECGAILKINKELKKVSCNYCGTEFLVNDQIKRVEINKNIKNHKIYTDEVKLKKLEYKDKAKKREIIVGFAIFAILILLEVVLITSIGPNKNETYIPLDAKKYRGENYEIVAQQLEDAGFKNIEYKPIKDLTTGWITKNGEVESISIAGDTEFEEGEIFSKNSHIVIIYHTFKDD